MQSRTKDPANRNDHAMWSGLAAVLLMAGCSTHPARSEQEQRAELEQTRDAYRPKGARPLLPPLSAESTRGDLARYAAFSSPRVEQSFYAWARSVEEITLARSRPDPTLSLEIEVSRMLEAFRPGFETMIPGPGKLALAAEAQSAQASAMRHMFEQTVLEAGLRAWTVWLRAAWLVDVISIRGEILAVVRDIEDLASTQFRVGKVSQQDVLRVQIERDTLETEIVSLEDSRTLILAEVRSALGIAPAEPPPPIPTRLPEKLSELPAGDLLDVALVNNHSLLALREEIREAESMFALARKSSQPDYSLGLKVDLLSPIMLMPMAGMTLPIYRDKTAAIVAAALASRHAADSALAGATLDLVVQLADANFRFRDANRRLELVRERLLPKAQASLETARSAYQTGMTDMTGLLDAERSLLEFRIEEITMRLEREVAAAEIRLVILGTQDTTRQ